MTIQKTAFLFPGQGAQFIGMGKDMYETFPQAKSVFQEVDEILHQNLSTLMFEGDLKELTQTKNAQPAIMAVSIAILRTLEGQGFPFKKNAFFVAGHSLGEYTALCAANALDLKQTAFLLQERGKAMGEISQSEAGGMMAILGLEPDKVQQVADESDCYVANDNGAGQWVLSGNLVALATAKMRAEVMGAKRVIPLPVAGAFHSPIMKKAQEKMAPLLKKTNFKHPDMPVVMNVSAKAEENEKNFGDLLIQQIVSPVKWRESILYMNKQGISQFVECGPGVVLSNLVRRIIPSISTKHISDVNSLQLFLESL